MPSPDLLDTKLLRIDPPAGSDVTLALREKTSPAHDHRRPPVLLLHGATFSSALFDLPRPGYSLMEALASGGRAVYALDTRGYGLSRGGAVMDASPGAHPPFGGTGDALQDVEAAAAFIRDRCDVAAIDLVGFSWGTITAARYAGAHPDKVRRLALYAPLYAERNPLWLGRIAPGLGAWRLVTAASFIERWNGDLPGGDPAAFREAGVAELVFDTLAALDPGATSRTPPAFRCPNGAMTDMLQVFNGRPLYDPAALTMPLLAIRGADDTTSTASDASRLLSLAASPEKQYREIAPGSHFLCIEKNRARLYDELDRFLRPL